jgi:hypothetical protein
MGSGGPAGTFAQTETERRVMGERFDLNNLEELMRDRDIILVDLIW